MNHRAHRDHRGGRLSLRYIKPQSTQSTLRRVLEIFVAESYDLI